MAQHTAGTAKKPIHRKNLKTPDETRQFGKGKIDVVTLAEFTIGRSTHEPGWKWSEHVKPIAKTDRCEAHHVGYVVQGRMKVRGADGSEEELSAGDAFVILPGHDAWTLGSEPAILLDFKSAAGYAKPK